MYRDSILYFPRKVLLSQNTAHDCLSRCLVAVARRSPIRRCFLTSHRRVSLLLLCVRRHRRCWWRTCYVYVLIVSFEMKMKFLSAVNWSGRASLTMARNKHMPATLSISSTLGNLVESNQPLNLDTITNSLMRVWEKNLFSRSYSDGVAGLIRGHTVYNILINWQTCVVRS